MGIECAAWPDDRSRRCAVRVGSHENGNRSDRANWRQGGRSKSETGRQREERAGGAGMGIDTREIPGFLFFDHFAVSVKQGDLEKQVAAYKAMGFTEIHREDVLGKDQVREVLLRIGEGPNLIQLLEPLSADSPVSKLMERNGGRGGFAHVAFRVADIQKAFDHMKANGFNLIDKAPRPGSRGTTV